MANVTESSSPVSTWLLHIELLETQPSIWRRVVVPSDIALADLHVVLQVAMGWEDQHLHQFKVGDALYGTTGEAFGDEAFRSESDYILSQAVGKKRSFYYLYDFGDGWEHKISIEKRDLAASAFPQRVYCVEGANACPPEDIGGVWGYYRVLDELADPEHPDHQYAVEGFADDFDPAFFDAAPANRDLLQFQPPEVREIYQVLKDVALGQRVMSLAKHQLESQKGDEVLTVEVEGWWIAFSFDAQGVALCMLCRAPDGRIGSMEDWHRPGTDPVAFLSAWEKQQLEGLFKTLV